MDIIGQTFIEITRTDKRLSENFKLIRKRLMGSLQEGKYESNLIDYGELTSFTWNQKASSVDSHLLLQHELGTTNQEITILALKDTGILQEKKSVLRRARPTLQISVGLLHLNDMVFTWERSLGANQQLITWGHNRNLEDTLELIKLFLQQANVSEIALALFAEGIHEKKKLLITSSVEDWLTAIISSTQYPEYLKFESDSCSVFVDVTPPFESGYSEIAVLYSDERLQKPIADFHHHSANSTLAPLLITTLLRRYELEFSQKTEAISQALEQPAAVEVTFE